MALTTLDLIVMAIPIVLVFVVSMMMRKYLRSVADYLAASRTAGRFMIATSASEIYATVILMMTSMEVTSKAGFSMGIWGAIPGLIFFYFTLVGIVTFRYRETRTLTFHQLLEVRFAKSVRVLASFLNVFSGLFNFGILPALAARFFVYFCGLTPVLLIGGVHVDTYIVVMIALMLLSLYMMLSGGQISVMITDALEGMISSILFLVVAAAIICTISFADVRTVLLSGAPGQSYIDPFDISSREDFNNWYVFLGIVYGIYLFRGGAWQAAFVASAKTAHESRMAQVLGTWRGASYGAMSTLAALGAFTLLHSPHYAAQQQLVEANLQGIGNAQMASQMRMPMALGLLLASGVKGAFCAVAIFGILASQGEQLHRYGTTFLQDVVLPFRKKPFEPHQHVFWLKFCSVFVAVFVCTVSVFYKPADYLVFIVSLIGVIYLGGVGIVVWGALYWRRATTQGALVSLGFAGFMGIAMNVIQPNWPSIAPKLAGWFGPGPTSNYFLVHTAKFPLNGLELSCLIALVSTIGFVTVSLLTCKEPFNLDAMLHRGKYRLVSETDLEIPQPKNNWLERFLDFDDNFTRNDRILVYVTLGWTLWGQLITVCIIAKTFIIGPNSPNWYVNWMFYYSLPVSITVGVITTIWFAYGVTRDSFSLLSSLKKVKENVLDDGTVRDHHNLGEGPLVKPEEPALKK